MNNIIKEITETYNIRGHDIPVTSKAEFNKETGEHVFNEKLDDIAINKAFDIFRSQHDVFGPQRIKKLRGYYNLSQRDFASMLGWSPTTLATYETGSLPSKNNNIILKQLEDNPTSAIAFYNETKQMMSEKGQIAMDDFVSHAKSNSVDKVTKMYSDMLFKKEVSIYNGFTEFNLNKVANFIVYLVTNTSRVTKTKLNKLLFYSDFKFFNEEAVSITGLSYAKLPYGPVPDKYESLYSIVNEMGCIHIVPSYDDNNIYVSDNKFDSSLFTDNELKVIDDIIELIGNKNATKLSKMSHLEEGWKNVNKGNLISYEYAQSLLI